MAGTEFLTADIVAVELRPADGAPLPEHRPGQHITVSTPDDATVRRNYSLTCSAEGSGRRSYSIAVRRVDDGCLSPFIHDRLRPGSQVLVTQAAGVFAVPTRHTQPIVLMAAGVGITPFMSFLETAALGAVDVPEIVLYHGSRNGESEAFGNRLRELSTTIPNLRTVHCYSRPSPDDLCRTERRRGRVGPALVDADLIRRRARFYVCGPSSMMEGVVDGLLARGVPRTESIHRAVHHSPTEGSDDGPFPGVDPVRALGTRTAVDPRRRDAASTGRAGRGGAPERLPRRPVRELRDPTALR